MKLILLVSLTFGVTFCYAETKIPLGFVGQWANKDVCESFVNGIPSPGVEITANEVNRSEYYCRLKSVIKSSTKMFSGNFECTQEGEVSSEIVVMALDKMGRLQVKNAGFPTLGRCKR